MAKKDLYTVEGDKIVRKNPFCPRCSEGVFMADHGDRCPKCGSALVKKEGKFGAFMSCSAFPNCRFSMDVKD